MPKSWIRHFILAEVTSSVGCHGPWVYLVTAHTTRSVIVLPGWHILLLMGIQFAIYIYTVIVGNYCIWISEVVTARIPYKKLAFIL